MQRIALTALLTLVTTTALAVDPIPKDSFDYFFENQKEMRDKLKKERQQYLLPKGERFTNNISAKDGIIAMRWFAVAGDPNSQAAMGDLFAKGLYEPQNLKSAVYWYDLAAENGNIYGMYMMALSYQLGWLGRVDANRAHEYFARAENNDDSARARRQVAQFFGDREGAMYNFNESYRWYEDAAEDGDIPSQLTLGDFYINGERTGKNVMTAIKWYGRAAAKNDPYAQYSLGIIYLAGDKLIPADYNQALKWIEKSAYQGFTAAQALLARMYYTGKGVPQNNVLAYAWWTLANQVTHPDIQDNLDQVTRKMSMDEIGQAVKLADYYLAGMS